MSIMGALLLRGFLCVCLSVTSVCADFSEDVKSASANLLNALTKDQQEQILLKRDHRLRWEMRYTGGGRKGVQISEMDASQQKLVDSLLGFVLSPHGLKMCDAVGKQDTAKGYKRHFITFFGDPRSTEDFGWRITEHHFTIVDVHFKGGELKEFGPILLGANPPSLWLEEEAHLMKAWSALGAEQDKHLRKGSAIASLPMESTHGSVFTEFSEGAQKHIRAAWSERMRIFSKPMRERVEALFSKNGGFAAMNASFYNAPATAHCKDGGRWDFKLGSKNCLFDFETSRSHIHSSIWVKSE